MAHKQKGYTLVEVMLFLAISGALFTISVIGMGGQQNRLRFKQSMEDIEFRIRNTLDNVDQGYNAKQNNDTNYTCDAAGAINAGSGTARCVFVGREINMCNSTMYVASRVAPYVKANYTDANSTIASTFIANQDDFNAPGGVVFLPSTTDASCRIAALNRTIGSSNQKVPRYKATAGTFDNWVAIDDTQPTKLCFRENRNAGRYATITLTQSDITLEVDSPRCDL